MPFVKGKTTVAGFISDERYLKEAERLLHNEFAYVLKISPDEVAQYILSRIK